ncbi:MAG: CoA transferase [Burkholderiaceae bacterium]|nr:CoA transferase [Burkholderiaceae bacterium]
MPANAIELPGLPAARAATVLAGLWADAALEPQALERVDLSGEQPVLPSSFSVDVAAQSSIAAAALAAAELGRLRNGVQQRVAVSRRDAAIECTGLFSVDGRVPPTWDKISGLYRCGDAEPAHWVRIHANFAHHRDGALRLLGCEPGPATEREAVAAALAGWRAEEFEDAAARAGLVVAAARRFEQWDAHPQAGAVAALPLVSIERIGDAPPLALPALAAGGRPLQGLRVLDLTRILAGPVCGRTLAAYGADVMLVNSPALPNIEAVADTSRGKLSTHIDLDRPQGRDALTALLRDAHVMVQGYRPDGLAARGFGPGQAAAVRPGIVYVSLSAYGHQGPWRGRRGFDSLVQTATGFNWAEGEAAGAPQPQALPVQILDYASGFLMAFGAQAALLRQAREGGSWHVRVALARTGLWLRSLGRVPDGLAVARPDAKAFLQISDSGFGRLAALPHAAQFSMTPAGWSRPSMPPGTHPPHWPS